jgi:drug/metabolite transporter (DMT)-like permease
VSDALTGLGLGALASLCWGIADFIARGAVRKVGDAYTLFAVLAVGGLGIAAYVLPGGVQAPSGAEAGLLVVTALLALGGYLALYRAFQVGMLSVVSPIAASNAVIPVVLALVVLGERPLPWQYGGIVLVLLGVVLLSFRGALPLPSDTQRLGVAPALVCMALFGLSLFCMKLAVDRLAPGTVALCVRVIGIAVLGAWLGLRGGLKIPPVGARGALATAGLLDAAAFVCFCEALRHTLLSLVAPISSTIPVVTVALAWALLKERLARPQKLGLALALGGLVLVAVA